MIEEKNIAILIYFLAGLGFSLVAPIISRHRVLTATIAPSAITLRTKARLAFGLLLGGATMTFMPWWLRQPESLVGISLSISKMAVVMVLTLATCWMLTREMSAEQDSVTSKRLRVLIYVAFLIGLVCLTFSTGWLLARPGPSLWHHWSAYLGPAMLVAEGAHPLYDIPTQYGLGITIALAQGCRADCWSAMYWISGCMAVTMTALLGYLSLQFAASRHPASVFATLSITLACGVIWTANPSGLAAPLTYPSTTGARFLPGVLMLTLLMWHLRRGHVRRASMAWGHFLWILCIIWSPEAGVHATVLWGSYFLWMQTWGRRGGSPIGRFARAAGVLVAVLLSGVGFVAACYRLVLGQFPEISTYLAYILYPPGALPINPFGTIWFSMACMICWCIGWWKVRGRDLYRAGPIDSQEILIVLSWLSALLCFASFSYYLGRSHDNNILNLLPFFALLLQATRSISPPGATKTLATTLLAACLAWLPVFDYAALMATYSKGNFFEFFPEKISKSLTRDTAGEPFYTATEREKKDLGAALEKIKSDYGESVVIFDRFLLIDSGNFGIPWSAWAGPANLVFLPSQWRKNYLKRVAGRLNRAGWLIFEKEESFILNDYDAVYVRAEELNFGTYRAIRFIPRAQP